MRSSSEGKPWFWISMIEKGRRPEDARFACACILQAAHIAEAASRAAALCKPHLVAGGYLPEAVEAAVGNIEPHLVPPDEFLFKPLGHEQTMAAKAATDALYRNSLN